MNDTTRPLDADPTRESRADEILYAIQHYPALVEAIRQIARAELAEAFVAASAAATDQLPTLGVRRFI